MINPQLNQIWATTKSLKNMSQCQTNAEPDQLKSQQGAPQLNHQQSCLTLRTTPESKQNTQMNHQHTYHWQLNQRKHHMNSGRQQLRQIRSHIEPQTIRPTRAEHTLNHLTTTTMHNTLNHKSWPWYNVVSICWTISKPQLHHMTLASNELNQSLTTYTPTTTTYIKYEQQSINCTETNLNM